MQRWAVPVGHSTSAPALGRDWESYRLGMRPQLLLPTALPSPLPQQCSLIYPNQDKVPGDGMPLGIWNVSFICWCFQLVQHPDAHSWLVFAGAPEGALLSATQFTGHLNGA